MFDLTADNILRRQTTSTLPPSIHQNLTFVQEQNVWLGHPLHTGVGTAGEIACRKEVRRVCMVQGRDKRTTKTYAVFRTNSNVVHTAVHQKKKTHEASKKKKNSCQNTPNTLFTYGCLDVCVSVCVMIDGLE